MKVAESINARSIKEIDLSIIIVNWNSKAYVSKCIESVLANTSGLTYEIIVVDSASFDGCGEMLQDLYPNIRFIQCDSNVGFARANNLGASYGCGSVLLFLNPDTKVCGHAIEHLYSHYNKLPHAGVVGCRLLNSDGSLQTSCVMPLPTILNQVFDAEILQRWFPKINLWLSATTFEGKSTPVSVEAVSGACMMINKKVFDQVKGFSTDYFMYAEDLDLCYKTHSAGFTNYYVPEAEIIHHGGGSTQHRRSSFANIMMRQSISRLLKKTHSSIYSLGYRMALSLSAVIRLILLVIWLPAWVLKRRRTASFSKWIGILRWGLGLESWVNKSEQVDS
jgi:GT2 family glycosyltransferase